MSFRQRLVTLCLFAAGLAVFATGPGWLGLDTEGHMVWQAVLTLGGPLAASIACLVASRQGSEGERAAWRHFCIGSGIYFLGNVGYLALVLANQAPEFPSLPEAAFFVMALFFAAGMLQFTQVKNRFGAVQVYNFALIYCAVALSAIFVLNHNIASSVMAPMATVVAFLYPALWFAVAAFGVLSLTLYAYGRKSVPYGLMVLAVLAEAVADGRYALALMSGTYQIGGVTQILWISSSGLIVWSAIEQIVEARRGRAEVTEKPKTRRSDRSVAQATVPALAVGAILLSGSISGVVGGRPFSYVAGLLAIAFALVAGFREHWIISTQRQLRSTVEKSREELAASRKQLASVLESTLDSVLVVDKHWDVVYWNHHAAETINQRDKLRVGISIWDLFPAALTSGEGDYYKHAVETGQPAEFEIFVSDRQLWLGIRAFPTEEGLSIFFSDISDQKRARDEIEHLAHHDPLTGLANRTLFQMRLAEAAGSDVAVMLVDLDHFKEVNDTLGHPVGDILLVSVANRLREVLGPEVTIARLGGDEFAAILVGHDGENEIAMIAMRLIETVGAPHHANGQPVRVGASIGIAMASRESAAMDDLFKDADIALYAAKTEARGAYRFFEPSMQIELLQKQALRSDLADALEHGEFALAFQPLVDLHTDRVACFEALLRWNHPRRGLVSPDEFIPVAEESGLIVPMGEWVLRQAAREAMRWPTEVAVAVNLSPRQFAAEGLAEMVERVLGETGLPAERLELEITETVLMRDSNANMQTLRRLRERGVRIALDDFGTGFSSLGYLQRFPFSKIKIDRAFISGLPDSEESQAIVRSVIGLGQSLGMRVTAEGVETSAQLAWVRNGCDEAQGYLLSRPVAATDVARVLADLNAPHDRRRLAS
jgi:diguanylate cyclase (GGDEF)-like protein